MKRNNPNRPRRREPYHFNATSAEYVACIRVALTNEKIPLCVLQMVYQVLLQYMHD